MSNIETQIFYSDRKPNLTESPVYRQGDKTKFSVDRALSMSQDVTRKLENQFFSEKEQAIHNARIESEKLSDEQEVNTIEAQLAAYFWKNTYDKMMQLNKKPALSIESVLSRFDVLEAA